MEPFWRYAVANTYSPGQWPTWVGFDVCSTQYLYEVKMTMKPFGNWEQIYKKSKNFCEM